MTVVVSCCCNLLVAVVAASLPGCCFCNTAVPETFAIITQAATLVQGTRMSSAVVVISGHGPNVAGLMSGTAAGDVV